MASIVETWRNLWTEKLGDRNVPRFFSRLSDEGEAVLAGISWGFNAAGPGFTLDTITPHDADIAEHEAVATAGSYNASANLINNNNTKWLMQMATFQAAASASANVHYYFSDHLGSTSVITDSTGSTIQAGGAPFSRNKSGCPTLCGFCKGWEDVSGRLH